MQATRLTEIVGNVLYILSKSNVIERKRFAEAVQDKNAPNENGNTTSLADVQEV